MNPQKLYDTEISEKDAEVLDDQMNSIENQIYYVSMKSVPLLLKLYINNIKVLNTIRRTNHILAEYYTNTNLKDSLVTNLIKDLSARLQEESNAKYRSMRYPQISILTKIIEVMNY